MEQYIVLPIAGAFVVYVAKEIMVPWVSGVIQRAPRVAGQDWVLYRIVGPEGDAREEREEGPFRIRQIGARVWVTHEDITPQGKGRIFKYRGLVVGDQVVLTYEEKDAEGVVAGSMVFKLKTTRDEMSGRSLYWHNDRHELAGEEYVARRPRP